MDRWIDGMGEIGKNNNKFWYDEKTVWKQNRKKMLDKQTQRVVDGISSFG